MQLKPILAFATILLKFYGTYRDGFLKVNNGYTWIALCYSTWFGVSRQLTDRLLSVPRTVRTCHLLEMPAY